MKDYHFYMQLTTAAGAGIGTAKDLEADFPGLYYSKCEGLEAVGAAKNIYTEDYAEANGLRVFHPTDVTGGEDVHKETEVKLTLIFVDSARRTAYTAFRTFLESGRIFYWDTARHKKVWLIFQKPVEPDADTLVPDGYIGCTFVFTNIWGIGKTCLDNGTLV